jgi:hypothetical protein
VRRFTQQIRIQLVSLLFLLALQLMKLKVKVEDSMFHKCMLRLKKVVDFHAPNFSVTATY